MEMGKSLPASFEKLFLIIILDRLTMSHRREIVGYLSSIIVIMIEYVKCLQKINNNKKQQESLTIFSY